MTNIADAETLARELNSQGKQHPRISMLLAPDVRIEDDEIVIALDWLDHDESVAIDTVIRFADYANQPPGQAAHAILDTITNA